MLKPKRVAKQAVKKLPVMSRVVIERDNYKKAHDILTIEKRQLIEDARTFASHRYVRGSGIEIGALHQPLPLPVEAKVRYVDYIPLDKLREQYPELADLPLVNVDIVDNGERLTKVKDSSVDFIIANHFLEHCQDPIGTLIAFVKKLRNDGILYMAIPDKRYTFDMYRPLTSYSHLLEEHRVYPTKKFFVDHCREVVRLTEGVTSRAQIEARVNALVDINYSIHHHVWTQKELIDFFYKSADKFGLDIEIEAMLNNVHEVIFIIRKVDIKREHAKVRAIEKHYFGNGKSKLKMGDASNKTVRG